MPTPLFDIPTFVKHLLPPNYRLPKWITAVQSFMKALTWRYGTFTAYKGGDAQPLWNAAVTYNTGDAVSWNYATYESLIDGNTGLHPDGWPSAWVMRCVSFIGADERAVYNGSYMSLTWALNRYFGTMFRQPPYPAPYGGGTYYSDIYITNVVPPFTSFISYTAEAGTSNVFTTGTGSNAVFTGSTFSDASTYAFTINIPVDFYASLGATLAISESIVRGFANQYVPAGISYSIATY